MTKIELISVKNDVFFNDRVKKLVVMRRQEEFNGFLSSFLINCQIPSEQFDFPDNGFVNESYGFKAYHFFNYEFDIDVVCTNGKIFMIIRMRTYSEKHVNDFIMRWCEFK